MYNRYLIELGSIRKPKNFSEDDDVDMMRSFDEDQMPSIRKINADAADDEGVQGILDQLEESKEDYRAPRGNITAPQIN